MRVVSLSLSVLPNEMIYAPWTEWERSRGGNKGNEIGLSLACSGSSPKCLLRPEKKYCTMILLVPACDLLALGQGWVYLNSSLLGGVETNWSGHLAGWVIVGRAPLADVFSSVEQ